MGFTLQESPCHITINPTRAHTTGGGEGVAFPDHWGGGKGGRRRAPRNSLPTSFWVADFFGVCQVSIEFPFFNQGDLVWVRPLNLVIDAIVRRVGQTFLVLETVSLLLFLQRSNEDA